MRRLVLLAAMMAVALPCSGAMPADLVFVKGGTFKNTKSNYYGKGVTVSSFYIGKYDVTQKEWTAVMGSNPSKFKGDKLPVESVNWYDAIEYCNNRSIREGLTPVSYTHLLNINAHARFPSPLIRGPVDG